eukprot:Tbor_TRINITY_DN3450_c0_g1::TRINITY_DN3450_c0_g1_i1::g.3703::m.3703
MKACGPPSISGRYWLATKNSPKWNGTIELSTYTAAANIHVGSITPFDGWSVLLMLSLTKEPTSAILRPVPYKYDAITVSDTPADIPRHNEISAIVLSLVRKWDIRIILGKSNIPVYLYLYIDRCSGMEIHIHNAIKYRNC